MRKLRSVLGWGVVAALALPLALLPLRTGNAAVSAPSASDFANYCVFGDESVTFEPVMHMGSGSVGSNGDIDIGGSYQIGGIEGDASFTGGTTGTADHVLVNGDVDLGGGTHVTHDVNAGGKVTGGANVEVDNVTAGGDVSLGNGSDVTHDANAGGKFTGGTTVTADNITASGDVFLGGSSHVTHDVNTGGNVTGGTSINADNIIASGDVSLGNSGHVTSDVKSGGNVALGNSTTHVDGNVSAVGTIAGGTIGGTSTPGASAPSPASPSAPSAYSPVSLPPATTFSSGGSDITTNPGPGGMTLTPGSYGAFNITGATTSFTFTTGDYFFDSFNYQSTYPALHFDVSGGPIRVFVKGDVAFRISSTVDVFGGTAAEVYWETHGDFTINGGSTWGGTVFAPDGQIFIGKTNKMTGEFWAKVVMTENDITITCVVCSCETPEPPSVAIATTPDPIATTVGATLNDTATLTGGDNPTGSITFKLYPPSDADCSGNPVYTKTVDVDGAGSYDTTLTGPETGSNVTDAAGTWRWTASYSGDGNNDAVASACGLETVIVTVLPQPTLETTPDPTATTVGATLNDTATLTGGDSPTGSITFKLYPPSDADCSGDPVYTKTVDVDGADSYDTTLTGPVTGSKVTNAAGTWRWTAVYSGDANNSTVTSACGLEDVTVRAQPTLETTPNPTATTIGGELNDMGALRDGESPTGTIIFRLYPPSDATCSGTPVFTSVVDVDSNGDYLTALGSSSGNNVADALGTWHWTAVYYGDANNNGAISDCAAESVTVDPANPTLETTPSPSATTVGATLNDAAILSGGQSPTGTITFRLYSPSSPGCSTPVYSSIVSVTGNGSFAASGGVASGSRVADAAGTWRWTATYSGDTNNSSATSGCGVENVTVGPTTTIVQTPTRTPTPGVTVEELPTATPVTPTAQVGGVRVTATPTSVTPTPSYQSEVESVKTLPGTGYGPTASGSSSTVLSWLLGIGVLMAGATLILSGWILSRRSK